jgi:hypothetical protein
LEQLIEKRSRTAAERFSFLVLLLSRGFADQHERRVVGTFARYRVSALRVETTLPALLDPPVQGPEGLFPSRAH